MKKKIIKVLKRIFIILIFISVAVFALNWYLKYRLEDYLRGSLSEKVSEATNGVYKLDFEDLSIGLISGELLIKGITFLPDSNLLIKDPFTGKIADNFAKIKVGSIYFKGVNLTWRTNYKKLNFDLFRIEEANIDLLDLRLSKDDANQDSVGGLNLYEMISPYINVLNVNKISLQNSSISYQVEGADGFVSQYSLQNINFEANDFSLDQDSQLSGKLLYSDNFNFHVDKPQTLISNGQFDLCTNQMIFDTKDSIIRIKDIQLIPKKELWKATNSLPDSYLEGDIQSIDVSGLYFDRKNGNNYLTVKSFDINKPKINYFALHRDTIANTSTTQADTLDLSWSLYSVISPLLNEVSIKMIGVNDANFKYTQYLSDDKKDVYTLDKVNLKALNFLIDSVSEAATKKRFLYSESFGIKAEGIKAIMADKNYIGSADEMLLNTFDRKFMLNNIQLKPIDTQTNDDYITGHINSVFIDSLRYHKGLESNLLRIDKPTIEYVRRALPQKTQNRSKTIRNNSNGSNLWEQVSPIFNHLAVKQIEIDDGLISFTDKLLDDRYNIYGFYFNASDILIDQTTIDNSDYFSAFDNFQFRFSHLEGISKSLQHQIELQQTNFSKKEKSFKIEKLRVKPLADFKYKAGAKKIDAFVPLIQFRGLEFIFTGLNLKDLKISTLDIKSPDVVINNVSKDQSLDNSDVIVTKTKILQNVQLQKLNITNAKFRNVFNVGKKEVRSTIKKLELEDLVWNIGHDINLSKLFLSEPKVWAFDRKSSEDAKKRNSLQSSISSALSRINITQLDIVRSELNFENETKKMNLDFPILSFSNLSWNKENFDLNQINIQNPTIKISESSQPITIAHKKSKKHDTKSIYTTLKAISNKIQIRDIAIDNANIDYDVTIDQQLTNKHKLNETDLRLKGLSINNLQETYNVSDLKLGVKNFHYPLQNGFYTLRVDKISFDNSQNVLSLDSIALIPAYSKKVFAYKDPRHTDWFDVRVGRVSLSGIDLQKYVVDKILKADSLNVDYVLLQNYKNQKIPIQHNVMPMIYEGLQKLPLKLSIDYATTNDFNVIYEELPRNNTIASKVVFTHMNGVLKGVTNIVSTPHQFIDLDADGYFMGTTYFSARWLLPVSTDYDCFILNGQMKNFPLTDLNPIIEPMSPVRIDDGIVNDVTFSIEGSSIGADVNMLMLYNNLKLTIEKGMDNSDTNTLLTKIVNAVLKSDNPKKKGSKPRHPDLYVERNPYHSTFNYLWQILQPPLVESVGISQKKQNFARRVSNAISSVKSLFKRDKKKSKEQKD